MKIEQVMSKIASSMAKDSQVIVNFNQGMSKGIVSIVIESDIESGLQATLFASGIHHDGAPINIDRAFQHIYIHSRAITEVL